MDIRPGYKQSEVGVIPEDWIIAALGSLTDPKRPISYGIVQTGPNVLDGVRCIRVLDIDDGRINNADLITTSRAISDAYKRTILKSGDLVTPLRGKVGDIASVDSEIAGCNLTRGLALIAIYADWNASFCKQFISSPATRNRLEQSMSGSALQEISIASLRTFKIALPPTKTEQQAIAEALGDADALIESLEQLLTKKRQLKQGAMQELLTGKKRLPGFEVKSGYKQSELGVIPEDWKTAELGHILTSMQLGGNYKNSERETSWPLIKMGNLGRGDINLKKFEFIDASQLPAARDRLVEGDILFNTRNTLDLVGKVAVWRSELPEAYFNSNILKMEFDEAFVSSRFFMNYVLNAPVSLKAFREIAIGTTSVAAIYSRDLLKIRVPLPVKPEQTAIATILSDMDADISALEAKLTKARAIKQGMMQQLLTGKIRLIEREPLSVKRGL